MIRARGYGVETTVSAAVDNNLKMLVMVVRCWEQIMAGVGEGLMSHTAYEGIADALLLVEGLPLPSHATLPPQHSLQELRA